MTFTLEWASLSERDIDLTRTFFALLTVDGKEYFSSDTFREYTLDRHFPRPEKQVGMLFAKWKVHGFIEAVGEVPSVIDSNHYRKNDLWRRTGKFERWMKEQQKL